MRHERAQGDGSTASPAIVALVRGQKFTNRHVTAFHALSMFFTRRFRPTRFDVRVHAGPGRPTVRDELTQAAAGDRSDLQARAGGERERGLAAAPALAGRRRREAHGLAHEWRSWGLRDSDPTAPHVQSATGDRCKARKRQALAQGGPRDAMRAARRLA